MMFSYGAASRYSGPEPKATGVVNGTPDTLVKLAEKAKTHLLISDYGLPRVIGGWTCNQQ
jgi:hypothetical protein